VKLQAFLTMAAMLLFFFAADLAWLQLQPLCRISNFRPAAATLITATASRFARVTVRRAEGNEVQPMKNNNVFRPVSVLCAECLFDIDMASEQEFALMANEVSRDMLVHFSPRNREANALLVAEEERSGDIVGSVGIELLALSPRAVRGNRVSAEEDVSMRPLLSNLAVSRQFRRRGIADRLCRGAEQVAREWGSEEVLLKVEKGNRAATRLYNKLGYRAVAEDDNAEKALPSSGGLKFVRTTNIIMRKDLRYPPLDRVLQSIVLFIALTVAISQYPGDSDNLNNVLLLLKEALASRSLEPLFKLMQ